MLSINISELLLTVLSFFVLMFLLNKLLFKPVIRFREERQSRMDESFRQESLAKEQQAQAQEEAWQQRLAGLKQAQEIAAQTQAQAGAEWQAAEKQIEQEAQAAMAQAAEDMETLCAASSRSLEQRRHELARTLADRLIEGTDKVKNTGRRVTVVGRMEHCLRADQLCHTGFCTGEIRQKDGCRHDQRQPPADQ